MQSKYLFSASWIIACIFSFPTIVLAHQPRIVETNSVVKIEDPEISKAYYGRLQGEPQVFEINASEAFKFYMNVLVPDVPGAKKDVSAALIDGKSSTIPMAVLDGVRGAWEPFFETFARDDYFKGPEFTSMLPPGRYQIRVWSSNNDSAYSLAVGEAESFGLKDIADAYVTIPKIKRSFFNKPAYSAYLTPFMGGPILLGALVIVGGGYLLWRKRFAFS